VTVDLREVQGVLSVEWFNPATGKSVQMLDVEGGGPQSFSKPSDFQADAILYLHARISSPITTSTPTCHKI
jgi:hypothetical protein